MSDDTIHIVLLYKTYKYYTILLGRCLSKFVVNTNMLSIYAKGGSKIFTAAF